MKIMKINSYYKEHKDAVLTLAKKGIELKVITNDSPYLLAQDSPDIVIHPNSRVMNGEYPTIKFLGPKCSFPNYEYIPEFGFDSQSVTHKTHPIKSKCAFINTRGEENAEFIKKLESMYYLRIWGVPTNSLGYMGPLNCNSYEIYNSSEVCAADNEAEILKIGYVGKMCHTPFDYMDNRLLFAHNLMLSDEERDKTRLFINQEEYFESKSWIAIFNRMFEICGEEKI